MQQFQNLRKLIHYNSRIALGHGLLAAVVFVAAMPVIFSIKILEYKEVVIIGELYLSILGIILFPGLAEIEDRDNIKEVVYTRKTPHYYIFIIRLLLVSFVIISLLAVMALVIKLNGGIFPFHKVVLGTFITSVFLGLIGLTISCISKNIASGYLVAFAYYLFEFVTRGKYTEDFYLFSLLKNSISEKYMLLTLIAAMLTINIVYVWKKS